MCNGGFALNSDGFSCRGECIDCDLLTIVTTIIIFLLKMWMNVLLMWTTVNIIAVTTMAPTPALVGQATDSTAMADSVMVTIQGNASFVLAY